MMPSIRAIGGLGAAVTLIACGVNRDRQDANGGTSSVQITMPKCNRAPELATELTFSDITEDSITGDRSGLQFTLKAQSGKLIGNVREASGELGAPSPLTDIAIGAGDRLTFASVTNTDTARFVGKISCDSLWGRWSPYPSVVDPHKVFRRLHTTR